MQIPYHLFNKQINVLPLFTQPCLSLLSFSSIFLAAFFECTTKIVAAIVNALVPIGSILPNIKDVYRLRTKPQFLSTIVCNPCRQGFIMQINNSSCTLFANGNAVYVLLSFFRQRTIKFYRILFLIFLFLTRLVKVNQKYTVSGQYQMTCCCGKKLRMHSQTRRRVLLTFCWAHKNPVCL